MADDIASAAKNGIKPGMFNKVKSVVSTLGAGVKSVFNSINLSGKAGANINESIAQKVSKATTEVADDALKQTCETGIKNIFKSLSKESFVDTICKAAAVFTNKNVARETIENVIENMGGKFAKNIISVKLERAALKGLAGIVARFSPLTLIMATGDFIYGWNHAYTIFGILDGGRYTLNIAHKAMAALINMINGFILGGIIPVEWIIDLVVDSIAPVFEIDVSELQDARDNYDEDLDKLNKESLASGGDTWDNLEDANNRNKWWTKIKDSVSSAFNSNKTSILSNINQYQTTGTIGSGTLNTGYGRDLNVSVSNAIYGKGRKFGKANTTTNNQIEDDVFEQVQNSVVRYNDVIRRNIVNEISAINKGRYNTYNKLEEYNKNDSTISSTASTTLGITSLYTSAVSMLNTAISTTKDTLSTVVSKWSSAKSSKKSDDNKISRALKGTLSVFSTSYWNTTDLSNMGIMGNVVTVQTLIEKAINAPVAIMHEIVKTMTNSINSIKTVFNTDLKDIWEWIEKFFTNEPTNTTKSTTKRTTTTKTGVIVNNGFGRGRKFGKAHIYQSGAVADIPYGDSTIGDAGCAPVAATNLLNSLGISSSLGDAATFAEANGMTVRGGGTDIDYFNHYLGSKGIATKSTNSRNDVMNALRNGDQVVMLGRDSTDGYGTPFGTDPHFVTAKGISKSGNIIAEDPDLPDQYVEYKPGKMMNSMISSVIADTGMGRNRKRFGRGKYGLGAAEVAMLDEYTITSTFDEPRSNSSSGIHGALDLVKYNNAPIYAFTNGTVKYTESRYAPDSGVYGSSDGGGFGNYVTLVDDDGYYHTYAHMNGVYVSPGDIINRGDQLGIQGHTGSSTGSHLHYQIAKGSVSGTKQNPKTYLQNYDSSSNDNSAYWDNEDNYYDDDNYYYDDSSSSNDSYTSDSSSSSSSSDYTTTSTKPTLFSALTNLGKSVARYLYGDAYNTIHGFSDTNTSISYNNSSYPSNSSSSSNNDSYYDDEYYYDDSSSSNNSYPSDSSSSSNSTVSDHTGTINKTYITSLMWKKFREEFGLTEAGAAGMMGNINAESAFLANNLQDTFNTKFGITDQQYTDQVNNKSRSKSSFVNDGAGYGYAQWTYGPRKEGLYEMSVENGVDIGAPYIQMDYINKELTSNYNDTGNILRSTNNVNTASDRVLRSYEAPADPESKVQTRRNYSWAVYNTYKGTGRSDSNLHKYKTGSSAKTLNDMSRTANVINNNYYGSARDTVDYATFLKTIVEILITISNNTSMLNKIVEILSSKFDITIDPNEVKSAATNANTRAQAERRINEMIESNNNLADRARILNNKDTSYLLSAMTAIAAE